MTVDLATTLTDYRTGLDAELALLAQLHDLAMRQHALPQPPSPEDLTALSLERERLLATLAALDEQVTPLRQRIAGHLPEARAYADFSGIAERHRRAADLVAQITTLDDESLALLTQADQTRRVAAQSLETGEATLAAYRRTLERPQAPAGFFTQRG